MNKAVKILLLFLLFTVTAIITVHLTGTQDAMEGWNNDPEELLRILPLPFPVHSCKWTKGVVSQRRNDFPPGPSASAQYICGAADIAPETVQEIHEKYHWTPCSTADGITIKKVPGYDISPNYMISEELTEELANLKSGGRAMILLSGNRIYFYVTE